MAKAIETGVFKKTARDAVENDVHAVGVSSLAAGHKTLIPQLMEELKKLGREDILVFAGGVIPAQDYGFLYQAGVVAIFGPDTSVAKAAAPLLFIIFCPYLSLFLNFARSFFTNLSISSPRTYTSEEYKFGLPSESCTKFRLVLETASSKRTGSR